MRRFFLILFLFITGCVHATPDYRPTSIALLTELYCLNSAGIGKTADALYTMCMKGATEHARLWNAYYDQSN